uniref:Uncharacterized protein n=1 Tax=Odontella aurita TaxID=265563 RepID=A0A7S4IIC5_9STRA
MSIPAKLPSVLIRYRREILGRVRCCPPMRVTATAAAQASVLPPPPRRNPPHGWPPTVKQNDDNSGRGHRDVDHPYPSLSRPPRRTTTRDSTKRSHTLSLSSELRSEGMGMVPFRKTVELVPASEQSLSLSTFTMIPPPTVAANAPLI